MKNDTGESKHKDNSGSMKDSGPAGAIYGLGVIGTAVYFITTATSFWTGVWGLIKAVLWPAFLIYYALQALGA